MFEQPFAGFIFRFITGRVVNKNTNGHARITGRYVPVIVIGRTVVDVCILYQVQVIDKLAYIGRKERYVNTTSGFMKCKNPSNRII